MPVKFSFRASALSAPIVFLALAITSAFAPTQSLLAKSSFGESIKTFERYRKMGVTMPAWFMIPGYPDDGKDPLRPKTPLDKTVSMQANLVFDAGANQAESYEVLMTNFSQEESAKLCETARSTIKLAPEYVQSRRSQRFFWIHIYSEGDVVQMTMTAPVLSKARP